MNVYITVCKSGLDNFCKCCTAEVGRREKRDETCNRNKIHLAALTFAISALEHKGYKGTQLD